MTEEEAEEGIDNPAMTIQAKTMPIVPQDHDRINNVKQKESALYKAGVTREKAFAVVARSLEAKKWADVIDRQGNVKQEWVDDIDKQRWAAEMVAKYFGDFVTTKETESNGIRQLIIIRPDSASGETKEVKTISRSIRIQSETVSRDVQFMGDGENNVLDISGNVIQRADT